MPIGLVTDHPETLSAGKYEMEGGGAEDGKPFVGLRIQSAVHGEVMCFFNPESARRVLELINAVLTRIDSPDADTSCDHPRLRHVEEI